MDPQPDPTLPDTTLASQLASSATLAPFADPALLIWALHKYPDMGDGDPADLDASGSPSSGSVAGPTDPSTAQTSPPSPASSENGADGDFQLSSWNPDQDWWPIQPDQSGLPDIRYRTARPNQDISTILGKSDPWLVGEFMRLNGLHSSLIRAGQTYRLPDPNALRLDGATALGLAAMKADEARRAARARAAAAANRITWGAESDGAAPSIDFSAAGMMGPGSAAHADSSSASPNWGELVSDRYLLAQTLASLRRPSDRDVIINGQTYEPFHTATADGLRLPPPSLRSYDPTGDRRAALVKTLGEMEDSPIGAAAYGGAKLLGADEQIAQNWLHFAGNLEGLGAAAAGLSEDPVWGTKRSPEFGAPPAPGLFGRSPETSLSEVGYGTHGQVADAVTSKSQEFHDRHYGQISQLVAQGVISDEPMRIGQELDARTRNSVRSWVANQGLREGPGEFIRLNRRLYDRGGSGAYRVPDMYFPGAGIILDGSMAAKDARSPQIRDFGKFSGGAKTVIIRPNGLGVTHFDNDPADVVGSYGIVR